MTSSGVSMDREAIQVLGPGTIQILLNLWNEEESIKKSREIVCWLKGEAESMIIFLLKMRWILVCLCMDGNDSVEEMRS